MDTEEHELIARLRLSLECARRERETAGRSDAGRHFSVLVTELETATLRAKVALGYVELP